MGRAPCCDKGNVKRGPWSPEEDAKLKAFIEQHGTFGNWIALPQKIGLKRCGKSCRLRWLNYLRPNLKHGSFSEQEDNIICSLYVTIGSRWSIIAAQLPGRTDNDIKNYWNTKLKKKLQDKQRKEETLAQGQADRVCSLMQEKKRKSTENLVSPVGVISQSNWPLEHSFPNINPVENGSSIDYYNLNNQTSSLKNLQNKLEGLQFSHENQQPFTANMHLQDSWEFNYFPQDQLLMNMINPEGTESTTVKNGSRMSSLVTESNGGWGEDHINSLVYNSVPMVSDNEGCEQRIMLDHVTFQEFGMQAQ